jgi:hypothetical protein
MATIAMASCLALGANAQGHARRTDDAVSRHCLSRNPGKLALSPDQQARIEAIRRSHPEGTERRTAILKVLTVTQLMIYRDMAGVGAC